MRIHRNNQKGFTLIELLIVLALAAAITVAAFIIAPRVQAAAAASTETDTLSAFQASMKSLFTTGDYSKVTNIVTSQGGMWPTSMTGTTPSATITNEWGGAVTVAPALADGSAGPTTSPANYFSVTYAAVPSNVCLKLLPGLIANWAYVSAGGTVVQSTNAATPVPYDATQVPTACGGTGGGTSVTLVLATN